NLAILARRMGAKGIVVPSANAQEAAAAGGIDVYPADTLTGVVGMLNETLEVEPYPEPEVEQMLAGAMPAVDFGDIRGQESAKRALVIAAAGLHNLLMIG